MFDNNVRQRNILPAVDTLSKLNITGEKSRFFFTSVGERSLMGHLAIQR